MFTYNRKFNLTYTKDSFYRFFDVSTKISELVVTLFVSIDFIIKTVSIDSLPKTRLDQRASSNSIFKNIYVYNDISGLNYSGSVKTYFIRIQ